MKRDSLNEKLLHNLPNITIDAEYVVDQNHTSEILVFAEFVWENTLEMEWLCDLEKLAGKNYYYITT